MTTFLVLLAIAALALAVSNWKDHDRTVRALRMGYRSFMNIMPTLLTMIGLISLVVALAPPAVLTRLFQMKGLVGFSVIALVGAIITIPGPVAFPLAGTLLKLGASLPALAVFVTTLMMVGIVTAPMEISYFGKRFVIMRQALSFILAVIIGTVMGVILR